MAVASTIPTGSGKAVEPLPAVSDPKAKSNTEPALYGVPPAPVYTPKYPRTTRPPYLFQYGKYPINVPRKGFNPSIQRYLNEVANNPDAAFASWAQVVPLRLLEFLGDVHPMVSAARSAWLRLAFGPENTLFTAVNEAGDNDDEGTAAIQSLLDSLPLEVGGQTGLQTTLADQVLFMGICCLECVPSAQNIGLIDLVTYDPTTIRFRDDAEGNRYLEQLQRGWYQSVNKATCLAIPFDGSRDNPYGRPLFASALSEGLADIARTQNLNDVLRTVAWPRLTVGFPFDRIVESAQNRPELLVGMGPAGAGGLPSNLTPSEYAQKLFNDLTDMMGDMKADDTFIYPEGGMVKILNGAEGMAGLQQPLEQLRLRMCMALDTLPSLLGITDGGTQAYSSVNWGVQAKKIESLRAFVNHVLCRAFNLHLQLIGLPLRTKAESDPIRSSDALVDEQAKQYRITNEQALVDAGYQTRETASILLTGSAPVIDDAAYQAHQDEQAQKEIDKAVAMKPDPYANSADKTKPATNAKN